MIWQRARPDGVIRIKCGSCRKEIKSGDLIAKTTSGLTRCEDCGRKIEAPHDVTEQEQASGVPAGVRHQPSLGFASTGEIARKHAANHFHKRTSRAR